VSKTATPNLRHRVQYGAMRTVLGALDLLSWKRAAALGERLGTLGYKPLGVRRKVVERQIAAAFPGLDEAEVLRIARESYAHLGRTTIETALLGTLPSDAVLGLFEGVDNWSCVERAMSAGKGLIFVTGHLGNWELGGAYLAARGVGLDVVVRNQENPLFDAYLNRTRERLGMTIVRDSEAVRRTPRSLKAGRAIAFLSDQGVLGLASTFVPFFGRPAKTPRGPAVFALRLKVPVVFGTALRQPSGRYRFSFEPVTVQDTGNRERDVDAVVAEYTKTLERWVRKAPEQYFWHHRRWKRQPDDTPDDLRDPAR
jgi:Kdo2-lipid IVA lauroyltransferase/acyltransferase